MNTIKKINELLELIKIKDINELNSYMNRPDTSVKLFQDCIAVVSGTEDFFNYNSILFDLYSDNKELYESVSKKAFFDFLEKKLVSWKIQNHNILKTDIDSIYSHFLDQEIIEYTVIKEIFGIILESTEELKLGSFTIYSQNYYKKILAKENKIFELENDIFWGNWNGDYLVTKIVKARDSEKAKEIAFEELSKFELFIYFTLNNYNEKHQISIISKLPFPYDNCHIFSKFSTTTSLSRIIIEPIPLDNKTFQDKSNGNYNLWPLIDNNNLNEMKKRIVSGIKWIGKANSEINKTNRFLFYIISLESIFTIQEKTLVNPSIASCICEGVAFIIGSTKEERILIEKIVKNLYSLRSTLAHGKDKNITDADLFYAGFFSTSVIHRFLSDAQLFNLNKTDDLLNYLKEKKYS